MGACSTKEPKSDANTVKPESKPKSEPQTNGTDKAPAAEPDLSQQGLLANDAQLVAKKAEFAELAQRFNQPASADVLEATKKALEAKNITVKIFADAKSALEYITALPQEGQSINSGGSRTLAEVGFNDWAKNQTKFKDFKAEALAAEATNDWGGAAAIRKQGSQADFFYCSLAAVTQDGSLIWGSMTGTRVSINAGTLVCVVGTQKIVRDEAEGDERLYQWQLPIESARARIVYKVKASGVNEYGVLRQRSPMSAPDSVQVVFVQGVLGF